VACGRPEHPDRVRCRLRRRPAGVRAGRPAGAESRPYPIRSGASAAEAAAYAGGQRPPTQARSRVPPGQGGDLDCAAARHHYQDQPSWHARACSWDRLHPRLTRRTWWIDHHGDLPVIGGTLIRLQVQHLPGDRDPKPLWLWCSATAATAADVHRRWRSFLRRFDLEHTFRLFKQTLGWTRPKIRDPEAADRWTWLIIAAHTQLRLARPLAADLRRPWERPAPPDRLTPARVRRGFRNLRATAAPASPCAETRQTRPRTATRHPQPHTSTPPRCRENRQTGAEHHRPEAARRLKIRLRPVVLELPVAASRQLRGDVVPVLPLAAGNSTLEVRLDG